MPSKEDVFKEIEQRYEQKEKAMAKTRKKLVWKLIFMTAITVGYTILKSSMGVIMTNEVALSQFEDSAASFTNFAQYNFLFNVADFVVAGIVFAIALPEIIRLVKKIKENMKDEED